MNFYELKWFKGAFMNRWIALIILAILIIIGTLIWMNPNSIYQPSEIRGAIDIGSGTTNLKVAKVNPETNKIISIIFEQTVPVGYQKQLEMSPTHEFNDQIMKDGIASIKLLKDLANEQGAQKVVAVATEAFRSAANSPTFAQEIEKQTGVQVRIIDQDEEGILAFRGALAFTPVDPQDAIVWDIGGGSMQFTTLSKQGTYLIDHGKTASIPFRNAIIQDIEKQNLATVSTPNPIDRATMDSAIDYARSKADQTDQFFKDKFIQPGVKVFAVGNLFNLGIHPLIDKDPIVSKKIMNQAELMEALNTLIDRNNEQLIDFSMPDVAVSNPILVLGYMQGLDIPKVEFVKVNNADGALSYAPYWK